MYPGHWAKVTPDKPALINAATGAIVTYRELDDRSNRLAQLMYDRGLRRGDHIAILMENHARYFDVVWAAMRSGLYLTTVNRYLTTDEATYIIDNCEAKVLVASNHLADIAAGLPAAQTRCKSWLMVDGAIAGYEDYEAAIGKYPARPLADEPSGAFMLYSSGTTGRPEGHPAPAAARRRSATTRVRSAHCRSSCGASIRTRCICRRRRCITPRRWVFRPARRRSAARS